MYFQLLLIVSLMFVQGRNIFSYERNAEKSLKSKPMKHEQKWQNHFKWMVSVSKGCLATLISDRLVLTAAHCMRSDPKQYIGNAGVAEVDSSTTQLYFDRFYIHPDFKKNAYDIGLMVTKNKITFNDYIGPICLHSGNDTIENQHLIGTELDRHHISGIDILKEVEMTENKTLECSENKICATWNPNTLESGDSGGALILMQNRSNPIQVGVYSGRGREKNKPLHVIYERVSYHRDFIMDVAKKLNTEVCFK